MHKLRLEAFSDAVIAIILTIMVLELKVPHEDTMAALAPLVPVFLAYVMSFLYLGIYWNNHHHMLHTAEHVDGSILWANLHLLFWLSLIPFVTAWMDENHFSALPTAIYGVVLLCAALGYTILQKRIVRHHGGKSSKLKIAIGRNYKGKVSLVAYAAAIPLAFHDTKISLALYALVALMWLVPDKRIERLLHDGHTHA
jgi:uncharacterized membrane protein